MFPRTEKREKSRFKTELHTALKNVEGSLRNFAVDSRKPVTNIVLSSNCSLGNTKPADPGIAVWFVWDGLQVCIPCDRYLTPAENLQAIHHVLEARRVELRHGTLSMVRATMTGFVALPGRGWREVMRFTPDYMPTVDEVTERYRSLARELHPDNGGSHDAMARLNGAKTEAFAELGL
jgi:hypothetical protein